MSSLQHDVFSRLRHHPGSVSMTPYVLSRWLKLCMSYIEFVAPEEFSLETGRMIKLLAEHPEGLSRDEILSLFYEHYVQSSFHRQNSFRICFEKSIQRARVGFAKYHLNIVFCKFTKKYFLAPRV